MILFKMCHSMDSHLVSGPPSTSRQISSVRSRRSVIGTALSCLSGSRFLPLLALTEYIEFSLDFQVFGQQKVSYSRYENPSCAYVSAILDEEGPHA